MSIFGGIFKVWFGGKARARRFGIIRLNAEADEAERLKNQNNPGADNGSDGTDGGDPGSDGSTTPKQISGTLALDRNGDGAIDPNADTAFKGDKAGATSALEGLQSYDTNDDGLIDVNDPQFQKFGVWNDKNNDGQYQSGEFETLAQLGIESIDVAAGLTNGLLTVNKTDGTTGLLSLTQSVSFP